jgi:hypothetical protein
MVRTTIFAGAVSIAFAGAAASAGTYSFTNLTNNNAVHAAAGESQLSLSTFATVDPQIVRISLSNAPGLASAVRIIFADDNAGVLAALHSISNTASVDFNAGSSGSLPGGNSVSFVEDHTLGLTADPPPTQSGINPGETLEWTYTLSGSNTLADLDAAMIAGTLRFGVHLIGLPNNGSEGFVTTTPNDPGELNLIPTPMAGMMGGLGLGILGARRRR